MGFNGIQLSNEIWLGLGWGLVSSSDEGLRAIARSRQISHGQVLWTSIRVPSGSYSHYVGNPVVSTMLRWTIFITVSHVFRECLGDFFCDQRDINYHQLSVPFFHCEVHGF